MTKIPIILYHDLCSEVDAKADSFNLDCGSFRQQMDYLDLNGFVGVSLEKLSMEVQAAKAKAASPAKQDLRKKIGLTFDDAGISHHREVLAVLKQKGWTATFFVTINDIGKKGRMDWTMIYDLAKNGMNIGSHGLAHSFLTSYNNYNLLNELLASKQILEKYLRKRIDYLSIPHGFYNRRVLGVAKDVGFKAVCVSDAGFNDFSSEGIFLLKRWTMRKGCSLKAFGSICSASPRSGVMLLENLRSRLRMLLGWQVYGRLYVFKQRGERIRKKDAC